MKKKSTNQGNIDHQNSQLLSARNLDNESVPEDIEEEEKEEVLPLIENNNNEEDDDPEFMEIQKLSTGLPEKKQKGNLLFGDQQAEEENYKTSQEMPPPNSPNE